ncbi:hypothetical protein Hypma_000653 [Hypsizygus marmoreus]|uniref:Uncharacterized protein n=1 Tax=Hypsizygus marmoreus TaxID=39966 RepID=A0A369JEL6_HYPMA|nr:hypothetical protein Hypma_000653 [Hypsizygus marmoreus]
MAKLMTTYAVTTSESQRQRAMALATDDCLGVWINGANIEDATWLLYHGVPCFLKHEVTPLEKSIAIPGPSNRYLWLKNFVEDTEVMHLYLKRNGYDAIAACYAKPSPTKTTLRIEVAPPPSPYPDHHHHSSSRAQGWQGRIIGFETVEPPTDWSNWGAETKYDAEPLEYIPLHPTRVDWLRPPQREMEYLGPGYQ